MLGGRRISGVSGNLFIRHIRKGILYDDRFKPNFGLSGRVPKLSFLLIRSGDISGRSVRTVRTDRPDMSPLRIRRKPHFGTFPDKPTFGLKRSPGKMPSRMCRINKFPDTPDILRLPSLKSIIKLSALAQGAFALV